jgi:hypothetical protein
MDSEMEFEMEGNKEEVCWVSIDSADNGYIVSYSIREKSLGKGKYGHVEHTEKKMLYSNKQEDEAFEMFVKMKKKELMCKKNGSSIAY